MANIKNLYNTNYIEYASYVIKDRAIRRILAGRFFGRQRRIGIGIARQPVRHARRKQVRIGGRDCWRQLAQR